MQDESIKAANIKAMDFFENADLREGLDTAPRT
jgi:hypothetical protein